MMHNEGMDIREHVPLAPLTTFGIGGSARYFADIQNADELRAVLRWAEERRLTHHIIAGGSNLLVPDDGLDALVIRIVPNKNDGHSMSIIRTTTPIYGSIANVVGASAGCNLLELIRRTAEEGLSGWEKLAGIPGTLGGAIRGNAGAFGIEMGDVIASVSVFDKSSHEVYELSNEACEFSYRDSIFKREPDKTILSARFHLAGGDRYESEEIIRQTIAEREKRHLQNVRAAGSYFMNPTAPLHVQKQFEMERETKTRQGRVPAGWLIERAGLKGARFGGAVASMQHPNYLVNENNATARDVHELAEHIRSVVESRFGVRLQEEVSILW